MATKIAAEGSTMVMDVRKADYLAKRIGGAIACIVCLYASTTAQADPWADAVLSYNQGTNPEPSYLNPSLVVGSPERYTGEIDFGGCCASNVTPFNSAFGTDEIVSVGATGHLTVQFNEPITDDPNHLYGMDFIIFGNSFFNDPNFNGTVAGIVEEGPFTVSVSADNVNYIPLPSLFEEGLFPALGYLDLTHPYFDPPGSIPSDFTRPMNPALTISDFMGLSFADVVDLYDGSGGGIPVDISASGLSYVSFVRIDVLSNATSIEIDGFSTVPEPATACLLVLAGALVCRRRR